MSEQTITKKGSVDKESRKQALYKYNHSAKGKACRKRYEQSKKGKENRIRKSVKYHKRFPERMKAVWAVNNAITSGKLPRPDTLQCHYCPAQAKQYHHHKGYAKEHWLDVVPACIPCHKKLA